MRSLFPLLCGALLVSAAAHAGTMIPVAPIPGAVTTNVFDINDNLEITGEYIDANGAAHGFFGPLNGSYTFFDFPDAASTEPRSINNAGYVLGFAADASFFAGPQYLRKPDGSFVNIKKDGVPLSGIAQGLTRRQVSTGSWLEADGHTRHGYIARNGRYQHDIDLGVPATSVNGRDVNTGGAIAGYYADGGGDHGFILDGSGLHSYELDDLGTTTFEGLNDSGIVSGQLLDEEGNSQGYTFDPSTETATFLVVPGATNVQAWGINRKGFVAISTEIGSYVYCPLKPRRCPAGGTAIHERKAQVREGVHAHASVPPRQKRGRAR